MVTHPPAADVPAPHPPESPAALRPNAWPQVKAILSATLSSTIFSLSLLLAVFLSGILFLNLKDSGPRAAATAAPAQPPAARPLIEATASPPASPTEPPRIPPDALKRPVPELAYRPSGRLSMENPYHITRGRDDQPSISLTFDGSAHSGDLAEILTILRQAEAPATFFLSGEFIENNPGGTRAIAAAGHEIGSHLYRHVHLTTWEANHRHSLRPEISRSVFHSLLQKNEALFREVTGREMKRFWRAPYGETNDTLDAWAAELGYRHVAWTRDYRREQSMDSLDWISEPAEPRYLNAGQIRERILSFGGGAPGGANGAIILMHLGSLRRNEQAWTVLEDIVTGMRRKNYSFVTISRLLEITP